MNRLYFGAAWLVALPMRALAICISLVTLPRTPFGRCAAQSLSGDDLSQVSPKNTQRWLVHA